jgi:hypothetical protein
MKSIVPLPALAIVPDRVNFIGEEENRNAEQIQDDLQK